MADNEVFHQVGGDDAKRPRYGIGSNGLVVELTGVQWKKAEQVRAITCGRRDNGYGRLEYWETKQIFYVDRRELTLVEEGING
jgi:hypothetical protein